MLTPLLHPSRLAAMKSVALPWNHVACMRPSSCHTPRKRSQSPASRHSTQFSTTSRMAMRARRSASAMGALSVVIGLQRRVDGAAVDQQVLADDEPGVGAAQERAGASELVGRSEAAGRNLGATRGRERLVVLTQLRRAL